MGDFHNYVVMVISSGGYADMHKISKLAAKSLKAKGQHFFIAVLHLEFSEAFKTTVVKCQGQSILG